MLATLRLPEKVLFALNLNIPEPVCVIFPEPDITPLKFCPPLTVDPKCNVPLFAIVPEYVPLPNWPDPVNFKVPAEIVVLPV